MPDCDGLPGGVPSAHIDRFVERSLPPRPLWPRMDYSTTPELAYPDRLNCAVELLDAAIVRGWGDRIVFHTPDGEWTYRDLNDRANRIARVLTEDLGLIAGNRVLLRGPNTPMMAACWFGVLKAGGVVVCTMPLLRSRELRFAVDKARIRLAMTDARYATECEQVMASHADGTPRKDACVVRFGPGSIAAGDDRSLEALMAKKNGTFESVETAADDAALIAFTSGTTGEGKGTVHLHRDVLAICDCFPRYVLLANAEDRFIGSPPFAFTFGLGGLLLFPMRIGASTILLEQATPPHLAQGIQRYGATVVFTAPTAYRAMLGLLKDHDVSSLRLCVSAGETLPAPTFQAWREATGIRIIDGIGATEMLHIFISASGDDIRPGATGRVVPGYEARVVDDALRDVPDGTIGMLAVRGPTGCRYLNDTDRQRTYVRDGWNLTGDSYIRDADGYFWYQARTDDMIVSAGYNISGPEIEAVLLEHPAVHECGVVGAPDPERGQVVCAHVVLHNGHEPSEETAKLLQEWVKSQLAPYKYPRRVVFQTSMPRTSTGKLQRFRLREAAALT
ncbi:MAG: Benzoate--CoA ligase [Gemmatimonadaceae bacterium]|nr:Benzoate--CoA ligase [Gemmatimonadaceae bacterium]